MNKFVSILSKDILAIAVCMSGVFVIPVCMFLLPIAFVWIVTDKLLRLLESA